jgi:hypothetical protein
MTVKEAMETWDSLGPLGRLVFLLRSEVMKSEYPTDDEPFFHALERFEKQKFEDLPGQLQDEFGLYAETPRFQQVWLRKGGEKLGKDLPWKKDESRGRDAV